MQHPTTFVIKIVKGARIGYPDKAATPLASVLGHGGAVGTPAAAIVVPGLTEMGVQRGRQACWRCLATVCGCLTKFDIPIGGLSVGGDTAVDTGAVASEGCSRAGLYHWFPG